MYTCSSADLGSLSEVFGIEDQYNPKTSRISSITKPDEFVPITIVPLVKPTSAAVSFCGGSANRLVVIPV